MKFYKSIIIMFTVLFTFSINLFSQESSIENKVFIRNDSLFEKDSRKPFSGSDIISNKSGKNIKVTLYRNGRKTDVFDYGNKSDIKNINMYQKRDREDNSGRCFGRVTDESGIPLEGALVTLKNTIYKVDSDSSGFFKFYDIPAGIYQLRSMFMGYHPWDSEKFEIKADHEVNFLPIKMYPMDFKPVLYLYPEKETKINVQIEHDNELLYCYPLYKKNGWSVTAFPSGKLFEQGTEKEFYCLFWETKRSRQYNLSKGFVLHRNNIREFLEDKLKILGLTRREANEFIIFWLPIMEKNEYSLVKFEDVTYQEDTILKIIPKPDTLIRIHMVLKKIDKPVKIKEQKLKKVSRSGFCAVEWGGTIVR